MKLEVFYLFVFVFVFAFFFFVCVCVVVCFFHKEYIFLIIPACISFNIFQ